MSTLGGYHEYIGGIMSTPGDTKMGVGGLFSTPRFPYKFNCFPNDLPYIYDIPPVYS